MFNRRSFLLAAVVGFSLPFLFALAQQWLERPIKFIVPSGAGGAADIVCRIFAAEPEKQLKQPVTIENKPGSGGTIGASAIAGCNALGYGNLVTLAIDPGLVANLGYNVQKEPIPVVQFTYTHNLPVVRTGLRVKSLNDLVGRIESNPPKSVTFASSGVGPQAISARLCLGRHLALMFPTSHTRRRLRYT